MIGANKTILSFYVFIIIIFSKINPADCVDMDCDAMKKLLFKDVDGTVLGSPGTVVSESEWEWGGDPRRGNLFYAFSENENGIF